MNFLWLTTGRLTNRNSPKIVDFSKNQALYFIIGLSARLGSVEISFFEAALGDTIFLPIDGG
ncbi:hypothetical protein EMIT0P74_30367 [Pseudomonas sp. IT-P74]|uniref:hypothetical protein n=1 Tax=unclassified Pseudomonas TaxID=196821 RepID=UPI000FDD718C|nr:hypothetical protein [Pseudomonas sp. RU47]AZZ77755.1 hypothetical protein CCX46_22280 [Pseudomonas sp. RU47]